MATLNDQILFDIPVTTGSYANYTLKVSVPEFYNDPTQKLAHTGRLYTYKENQLLSVNDILSSYSDNYSWMSPESVRVFNRHKEYETLLDVQIKNEDRVQIVADVNFGSSNVTQQVSLYYPNPQRAGLTTPDQYWVNNSTAGGINFLELQTNIIPRIPRLNVTSTDFFVGGLFAVNRGWRTLSEVDGDGVFSVTLLNSAKVPIPAENDLLNYSSYDLLKPYTSVLIGGNLINGSSPYGFDINNPEYKYIAITGVEIGWDGVIPTTNNIPPIILAEYDDCNHDYYLIWCDRSGGYQCQPFNSHTTKKEDITTTTITNMLDEQRPIIKSVSNSYDLKSDWLTFDEYNAYESIFVSPYLYLYDTKFNNLTVVNCTQKQWIEKTIQNTKKPFNLNITVTANRNQNIRY